MDCLILARGGSKGVPKKNIKLLNGIPLICHVINEAKKTKNIKNIYVSTDCQEIVDKVKEYKITIVDRPDYLAQDNTTDLECFRHFCKNYECTESLVHLRATTPLINHEVLDNAIEIFMHNMNNYTSLRSAHEMSESAYKFFIKDKETWKPIVSGIDQNQPRQSYPKTYVPNGYIDIVTPKVFMTSDSFYGEKIYPYITEKTYEIDTIEDFEYIEYILNKKNVRVQD